MIQHADCPIQTYNCADDQESRRDDPKRVFVGETDGQNGSRELPRGGIEGVREPVGDEGPDGPLPVAWADGVEVFITPTTGSHCAREGGRDLLHAPLGHVEPGMAKFVGHVLLR